MYVALEFSFARKSNASDCRKLNFVCKNFCHEKITLFMYFVSSCRHYSNAKNFQYLHQESHSTISYGKINEKRIGEVQSMTCHNIFGVVLSLFEAIVLTIDIYFKDVPFELKINMSKNCILLLICQNT